MTLKLKRNKESHKGSNGEVLVIGGSELYTGAPALCGMAAFRSGVDLVFIAAPYRSADVCAHMKPDFITIPLHGKFLGEEHLPIIKKWFEKADAVVMGPGLGLEKATEKAALSIIKSCDKPLVLDADALKIVAKDLKSLKDSEVILTPHRREFELLLGESAAPENVRKFAANNDVVVLLKAPKDIVTDGHKVEINKTGNAGMTVGGTGDVLAGLVGGLVAQGVSLFDAALYGARVNGMAGNLCYEEKGYGFIASDLVEKIPKVLKEF